MDFPTIQNPTDYDAQSIVDGTDFTCMALGAQGTGVLSGMAVIPVTPTPNMYVVVESGALVLEGVAYDFAGGQTVNPFAAASAGDRRDIVWGTYVGGQVVVNITSGVPCTVANWHFAFPQEPPIKPALPDGCVLLAEVYVQGYLSVPTTQVTSAEIVDKRLMVSPPGAGVSGGTGINVTDDVVSIEPTGVGAGSGGDGSHTVSLTWNAEGQLTEASVNAISIPHTQISDWAATISSALAGYFNEAGAGLTSSDGTVSLADVGTAGTVGDAAHTLVVTTNATGQVESITVDAIAISHSQVTDWTSATAGFLNAVGTGLSLSGQTVSLPAVGTAGTSGDAGHTLVITTDAEGRVSGVTVDLISIPHGQISDWAAATSSFLTSLTPGTGISISGSTISIAPTGVSAAAYGASDHTVTLTVNAEGQITAIASNSIAITESQVTGLVSDLAAKVPTSRNVNVSARLTGGGALSADLTLDLATVGTASTYTKVTTDAYGRVISGTTLSAGDIPNIAESQVTGLTTDLAAKAPTASPTFTGTVTVPAPVNPSDAATKNYVDSAIQGLDPKPSVRALAAANISLSGTQTVDTVALSIGDRVLAIGQTTASQNGLWVVASGAWTRPTDYATGSTQLGAFCYVDQGTTYKGSGWLLTGTAITVDTSAETWQQFTSAGSVAAGTGITVTGTTVSISNIGTAGTSGDASHTLVVTVNAQGQVTGVTVDAIAIAHGQISDWSTATAGFVNAVGQGLSLSGQTVSMPNVGTAATTGDASHTLVITTDAEGRVTAVVSDSISIAHTQISDWASATASFLTSLTPGTGINIVGSTVSLANQIAAAAAQGSATAVPVLTYNAQGQLTAVTVTSINIPHSQISDWATYAIALATDLGGTVAAPEVVGFYGKPLTAAASVDAQWYVYNSATGKFAPVVASGDATMNDSGVISLKAVGPGAGSLGTTAAETAALTLDANGRVTAASNVAIAIAISQVTGLSAALAALAPLTGAALVNPTLSGATLTATPSPLDNSTKVADTSYVDSAVAVETTRAESVEAGLAPVSLIRQPETLNIVCSDAATYNGRGLRGDIILPGTVTAGVGDEGVINTAIAALRTQSSGRGLSVKFSEGHPYLGTNANSYIGFDTDYTTIKGDDGATRIIQAGGIGPTAARAAAIIAGLTRDVNQPRFEDFFVGSYDGGSSAGLVNFGHGILINASGQPVVHNVQVGYTELDSINLTRLGVVASSSTLAASVATTPAVGTLETWNVNAVPAFTAGSVNGSLCNLPATLTSNGQYLVAQIIPAAGGVNQIEEIAIFSGTAGALYVARGWNGYVTTHSNGDTINFITRATAYLPEINEVFLQFPGRDGLSTDFCYSDGNFHRVVVSGALGGAKTGRYGINDRAQTPSYVKCHPYYMGSHGIFHNNCTSVGNPRIELGDYESNGGDNIHIENAGNGGNVSIIGVSQFNAGGSDINCSNVANLDIDACKSMGSTNSGSTYAPYILTSCTDYSVTNNRLTQNYATGTTGIQGIRLVSCSGGLVGSNKVYRLATTCTSSIFLSSTMHTEVVGNLLDQGVAEGGSSDWNKIHHNNFIAPPTGGAAYTTTSGIYIIGTHSSREKNTGYISGGGTTGPYVGGDISNSKSFLSGNPATTYSANDGDLVTVANGAMTITSPPCVEGYEFELVNANATTAVTLTASSGNLNGLSGTTTYTLAAGSGIRIYSDGYNWFCAASNLTQVKEFNPVEYGADPTGVGESTAAFVACWADAVSFAGANPGVGAAFEMPAGIFLGDPSASGWPSRTTLAESGISFRGAGKTSTILLHKSGTRGIMFNTAMTDPDYWTYGAWTTEGQFRPCAPVEGFTINGQHAANGSIGYTVGGIGGYYDIYVANYYQTPTSGWPTTGYAGSRGLRMFNPVDTGSGQRYSERNVFGPNTGFENCYINRELDTAGGTASFARTIFQNCSIQVESPGQTDLVLRGSGGTPAVLYGSNLRTVGNSLNNVGGSPTHLYVGTRVAAAGLSGTVTNIPLTGTLSTEIFDGQLILLNQGNEQTQAGTVTLATTLTGGVQVTAVSVSSSLTYSYGEYLIVSNGGAYIKCFITGTGSGTSIPVTAITPYTTFSSGAAINLTGTMQAAMVYGDNAVGATSINVYAMTMRSSFTSCSIELASALTIVGWPGTNATGYQGGAIPGGAASATATDGSSWNTSVAQVAVETNNATFPSTIAHYTRPTATISVSGHVDTATYSTAIDEKGIGSLQGTINVAGVWNSNTNMAAGFIPGFQGAEAWMFSMPTPTAAASVAPFSVSGMRTDSGGNIRIGPNGPSNVVGGLLHLDPFYGYPNQVSSTVTNGNAYTSLTLSSVAPTFTGTQAFVLTSPDGSHRQIVYATSGSGTTTLTVQSFVANYNYSGGYITVGLVTVSNTGATHLGGGTLDGITTATAATLDITNFAEAQPNATLASGVLSLGPGGSTAVDTTLTRSAAGVLTVSGTGTVGAIGISGLGSLSPGRFVGVTATGAPTSGTYQQGDFILTNDGHMWVCTVAGTEGTWVDVAAAAYALASTANTTANNAMPLSGGTFTGSIGFGHTGGYKITGLANGAGSAAHDAVGVYNVPTLDQFLQFDGSEWVAVTLSTDIEALPSGNMNVIGLNGYPISQNTPTDGQMWVYQASIGTWELVTLSGDATITNTGSMNVSTVQGGHTPIIATGANAFTGNQSMGSNRLNHVQAGVAPTDAANVGQVPSKGFIAGMALALG